MTHNNYYGEKIRWEGTNTSRNITWIYGADTLEELYNKLVEADIISVVDTDPYMDYMLYKVGLSMNDCPEELYDDWEDVVKWFEEKTKSVEMTDFDWWDLISSQDGNAYYQKFYLKDGSELSV